MYIYIYIYTHSYNTQPPHKRRRSQIVVSIPPQPQFATTLQEKMKLENTRIGRILHPETNLLTCIRKHMFSYHHFDVHHRIQRNGTARLQRPCVSYLCFAFMHAAVQRLMFHPGSTPTCTRNYTAFTHFSSFMARAPASSRLTLCL
jgi:hypothetical protein